MVFVDSSSEFLCLLDSVIEEGKFLLVILLVGMVSGIIVEFLLVIWKLVSDEVDV